MGKKKQRTSDESSPEKSITKKNLRTPNAKKNSCSSPIGKQVSPLREIPGPSGDHSINDGSTDEPYSSSSVEPPSSEYESPSSENDATIATESQIISKSKEDKKSLTGLLKKLLDPSILCIFIAVVAFFTALPAKKAFFEVDNTRELELERFNFRRNTFTQDYQLSQRDQNLIFAVVNRQRIVNPPERPLVFLLMTPALTPQNLEFANDLGRLARGQDVKSIQSHKVQSRNSLMDELEKSFHEDKGAIIEHFEEMPSDAALAFYGITDERALESAKNKTIVILFEDKKTRSTKAEMILLTWMEEKGIDTKLNRGLISRISENVLYLD